MDERAYLAQALLAQLHDRLPEGATVCTLDDGEHSGEVELVLARRALAGVPAALARFCRDFDLRLVQLVRREPCAWQAVLAWSDDVGRPRFLCASVFSDWYSDGVLLLRAAELRAPGPDVRFAHALLKCVARGLVGEEEGRRIAALWHEAPRQAMEQVARFWRRPADLRVLAQAARQDSWAHVRAQLPRLRRAMRRGSPYRFASALGRLRTALSDALEPSRAALAFVGEDRARREVVRRAVVRDLAPAFPRGTASIAYPPQDEHWGIDLRIAVDDTPLPTLVSGAVNTVLHWLESRVERRYPEALVGRNPPSAWLLQAASRMKLPFVKNAVQVVLNSDIEAPLASPVLMPHPYGIVIERGAQIGHRVTIMQQATLGRAESGVPVVEDNAWIGPGARILGGVRIGRYATVGANAVVTRDVPSHCTVIGTNQIVGQPPGLVVVPERRATRRSVVNS